ncbi:MAG: hypothetical protein AAF845_15080 [Bacteroidota bacterium]
MTDADRRAALNRAEAWGVDLSLLRERLRMTPAERLTRHAEALARVQAVRRAADARRPTPPSRG